jgi:hypothetical protein
MYLLDCAKYGRIIDRLRPPKAIFRYGDGGFFWWKDALVDAGDAPALNDAGKKIGPVK